ncbi:hypothetical protein ACX27_04245 [Nostoc piscinale CENA21]|uniref:Uncharacterized protein n=1 Tax=Nostoc piscinale CENA21 TaxID=224013 RepID=A0A0M4T1R4_9NOSO|nr:hypothetical protein [Nostoc piscinale]ALF52241.1 hypothetical protein ACX27_04245 [Nostoc piscinale CENA21]
MEPTQDTRPKTNYTQQMISLRDCIAPLVDAFGIPTARSLIIQRRFQEDGRLKIEYFAVEPKPIIDRVPPAIASAFNTDLQIKIDDLQVSGISRKYPREWIVGTGISYFADAQLLLDRIVGGFEAEFVSIDELPLTWNLILRRRTDERRGI